MLDYLISLLKLIPSPENNRKDFIILTCSCEFEPFGRATEDFDLIWRLKLPTVQYYWKSTTGWRTGKEGLNAEFYGETPDKVIDKAVRFLEECPQAIP